MKLEIKNLSKTYKNGVKALDNVTLDIEKGMFGLLGANGAGKSTLMRTISTLQDADQGSIKMLGIDFLKEKNKVRELLGYLPQDFGLYPKVSVYGMLDFFSRIKGINEKNDRKREIDFLLEQTNLTQDRNLKTKELSGGMKQRLAIAIALIGDPKLIIVDEPTAGLDPSERRRFLNLLSRIGENKIIILSTHIVDDVNQLCSNMAILNKGKILEQGKPSDLIKKYNNKIWEKTIETTELKSFSENFKIVSTRLYMGKTIIHIESDEDLSYDFKQVSPTLEDVYLATVNNKTLQLT